MRAFAGLQKEALGLARGREIAAFIVAEPDGTLSLSRWPSGAELHRETFVGRVPARTVAIVHTHPGDWHLPSQVDVGESLRLGLPNYVISRRLWVVDPESGETYELARFGWAGAAGRSDCRSDSPDRDEPPRGAPVETRRAE